MDELLQLDLSNPSPTLTQPDSQPQPTSHDQPSVPGDEQQKHSAAAWTSPFAAWDSMVGVSPTESVRRHTSSRPAHIARPSRAVKQGLWCAV